MITFHHLSCLHSLKKFITKITILGRIQMQKSGVGRQTHPRPRVRHENVIQMHQRARHSKYINKQKYSSTSRCCGRTSKQLAERAEVLVHGVTGAEAPVVGALVLAAGGALQAGTDFLRGVRLCPTRPGPPGRTLLQPQGMRFPLTSHREGAGVRDPRKT